MAQAQIRRSVAPTNGDINWLPFFYAPWFGHPSESGHDVGHAVAGWEDRDDVAEPTYF
jgi:hypothetical protein